MDKYEFYATGDSQGRSIRLRDLPPIPAQSYLPNEIEYTEFPPRIDDLVEAFLVGLEREPKFLTDTKEHHENVLQFQRKVFRRIDSLSAKELKQAIVKHIMMKRPNRNRVFAQIDEDLVKFKRVLKFVRDFGGSPVDDPVERINRLLDKTDESLYVKGGGVFFISQLLAAAYPDDYLVVHENQSKALMDLGLMDLLVKQDTANGYIYVNELHKKLFREKLKDRVAGYGFSLPAVANLLWHYYRYYRVSKRWYA